MIEQFNWKHIAIASSLTIALCVGFFLYNQWDVSRFRESLNDSSTPIIENRQTEKNIHNETEVSIEKATHPKSDTEKPEEVPENEDTNMKDADFYDFLDYLDELDEEEIAQLFENLDLEEDEKETLTELAEENAENTEGIHPSSMIVNMMESGVASLAGLIELMEESTNIMPESVQERFIPVLNTLQEMEVNGGGLIFHRPPENPDNYMLIYINPRPSQRDRGFSITDDNIIHEFPSNDPNKESLFLHKGNSIIID